VSIYPVCHGCGGFPRSPGIRRSPALSWLDPVRDSPRLLLEPTLLSGFLPLLFTTPPPYPLAFLFLCTCQCAWSFLELLLVLPLPFPGVPIQVGAQFPQLLCAEFFCGVLCFSVSLSLWSFIYLSNLYTPPGVGLKLTTAKSRVACSSNWANHVPHLWHFLNLEHFFPPSPKFLLLHILSIPWYTSFLRPSVISPSSEFPCHFHLFFSTTSHLSRKSEQKT